MKKNSVLQFLGFGLFVEENRFPSLKDDISCFFLILWSCDESFLNRFGKYFSTMRLLLKEKHSLKDWIFWCFELE